MIRLQKYSISVMSGKVVLFSVFLSAFFGLFLLTYFCWLPIALISCRPISIVRYFILFFGIFHAFIRIFVGNVCSFARFVEECARMRLLLRLFDSACVLIILICESMIFTSPVVSVVTPFKEGFKVVSGCFVVCF